MQNAVTKMFVARRRLGLSQAALASMIGVTQPRISSWETGRAAIPKQRLGQIADILDPEGLETDPDWLTQTA